MIKLDLGALLILVLKLMLHVNYWSIHVATIFSSVYMLRSLIAHTAVV